MPSNISREGPTDVEGAGGPGCGACGWWRGLAGLWDDVPSNISREGPTGVEGAGGTGGPGCGACGWWRALAGQRADAPSEARSADGSWPGRRPRRSTAQQCAHSGRARRRPEYPWGPLIDARIQPECPASRVARWTPPRPASCAAWVRHENPSARYTASGCADRDGSRECDATATDRS